MRQRDKLDLPLPVSSYKYFLLRYSFSVLSFYSPKSIFLAAAPPEDSKNFIKGLLHQPQVSDLLLLKKMEINFIVPEVSSSPLSCTFTALLFIRSSSY